MAEKQTSLFSTVFGFEDFVQFFGDQVAAGGEPHFDDCDDAGLRVGDVIPDVL